MAAKERDVMRVWMAAAAMLVLGGAPA